MHFSTLQTGLFIFLIASATALFGWLVHDYLQPIFWAIVLAILFHPVYEYFYRVTKKRGSLAATLTMLFVLVIVLVPTYILGYLVVHEAVDLYERLSSGTVSWEGLSVLVQTLGAFLEPVGITAADIEARITGVVQNVSAQLGPELLNAGRATASTIIGVGVSLYLLFFALRDGVALKERVIHALPLGDKKERMLAARFVTIVRAMFRGTFIIAIIQAIIGGILFAAVGVPSAVLWAFVMGIFALIPAVGPAIVWVPAGALLIISGSVWEGVVVLAVGSIIISLVDNLLRPVLVGKRAAMPDALVLLSVIGGLSLFGIAGIIIGPVITALFLSMWQLFEYDYAQELETRG